MNAKRWAALIVAISLFFASVVYQVALGGSAEVTATLFSEEEFEEKTIKEGNLKEKIVVLNLEGVIQDTGEGSLINPLAYDHKGFLRMIEKAGADDTVDGVIVKVNTPGGGVVESAEIHDKIVDIQEEHKKPVYISMGNTAASGGYYIAAPADKIIAHPATLTGSIGVIMENINFTELADKLGVDFNTIKSGKYKDIMSASRPMTEDDEAILQTMIDELYDEFVQIIVDGRDMTEAEVKKIADGRIYTGKQAHQLNLVDGLGTMDDTIKMMEEDYDLNDARVVEYEAGFGFGNIFTLSANKIFGSDSDLTGLINMIRDSSGPRAMYLYSN